MSTTFQIQKIDPTCSNIYLIDQNACLGNSLSAINLNVTTLSANLEDMSRDFDSWTYVSNIFSGVSSTILSTLFNIVTINDMVESPLSTVQNLSSVWASPFSLYYPYLTGLECSNYPQLISNFSDWLTDHFPTENFTDNQIIYLNANFYYDLIHNFSFQKSYEELCKPNGGTTTVSCNGCGNDNLGNLENQGCNHHGGLAGVGPCDNAYSHCGNATHNAATASYSCIGTGGKTLTINFSAASTNQILGRVLIYPFINVDNTWTYKQELLPI